MNTQPDNHSHVLVFGNEKGGSGKSTAALHTAVALLRMGYKVGTIDLDARQATLTRAMRNRFNFITRTKEP
ncbi:MAG: division plane positioning ATPase MipZ, partial [Alphaproteobacteria bacterium]|nr:division plane positioning ATPase MipZ [Alphaproteobacteria bacterium]